MGSRVRVTWRWNGRALGFHLAGWWSAPQANDVLAWGIPLGGVSKTGPEGGRLAHDEKHQQKNCTSPRRRS